jgi:diguanylate cyclase (GGDEF)-like protein
MVEGGFQLMVVTGSGKEPLPVEAAIDADLARAEIEINLGTGGFAERADKLAARARAAGLVSRVRRATLLRSDAMSRCGELEEALRMQLETLTEAELDADRMVCARAHFLLAATYDRLAELGKALRSAEECVRLLVPEDPPSWHAEHMGVLALSTSYWRVGDPDYTTFEEALRLARELGDPVLLLAIMNNYVYTAVTRGDERGAAMTEEMRRLAERELPEGYPSAWLDTIAFGLMDAGRLDEAAEFAAAAVEAAPRDNVEPTVFAMCILTQAKIERARGNFEQAVERAGAALEHGRTAGVNEAIGRALEELSELAAEAGDYRRAYEYLRERNEALDLFQTERSELHAVTLQAIYAVEVERQQRLALEALADTDPLTGLYNRRYMNRHLAQLVQEPVALALVDIDHFKRINDRFGHEAGDRVLVRLVQILQEHVETVGHEAAFAARIGGEEFVLALPGITAADARDCCERVRSELELDDWDEIAPGLRVTVSVGLATQPIGGGAPSSLLSRADTQLYSAKRQGRNRVVSEHST